MDTIKNKWIPKAAEIIHVEDQDSNNTLNKHEFIAVTADGSFLLWNSDKTNTLKVSPEMCSKVLHKAPFGMFGATREGELRRTSEMMVEITEKYRDNPLRAVADSLHMLRSTNRTTAEDLKDLQDILDDKLKARRKKETKEKVVDFEDTYCEASKENLEALKSKNISLAGKYTEKNGLTNKNSFWHISNKQIHWVSDTLLPEGLKKIELIDGEWEFSKKNEVNIDDYIQDQEASRDVSVTAELK